MKKLYWTSVIYMVIGLLMGVFYREFTKLNNFEGRTVLSFIHTHSIALGFIFFLLVLILEKQFELSSFKFYKAFFTVYNIGLIITLATFTVRGIMQVLDTDMKGLNHIAGTGHAVLAAGIILFFMNLNKALSMEKTISTKKSHKL